MISAEIKLRVRYAETDQMGYVYYGNYAQYYELGRIELLRELALSYKEMETKGIMLPVLTFHVKYIKPSFYDDELTIRTTVSELPTTRMVFRYQIFNASAVLLNEAETTHAFITKTTRRPSKAPDFLLEKIGHLF